jgi:hypothetical protein
VRKSIVISNDRNNFLPIMVSGGLNISLRAADFIEINEGFVVDEDSEFFADVTGGCDEGH